MFNDVRRVLNANERYTIQNKPHVGRESQLLVKGASVRGTGVVLGVIIIICGFVATHEALSEYSRFQFGIAFSTLCPYLVAGCVLIDVSLLLAVVLEHFADMHYYARLSAEKALGVVKTQPPVQTPPYTPPQQYVQPQQYTQPQQPYVQPQQPPQNNGSSIKW